ncbi:MAG: hypothetical protein LIO56_02400 [Lachnospiraceae bacterium]|nr:hypothetical protein [Lachnospiraceae bacterium]
MKKRFLTVALCVCLGAGMAAMAGCGKNDTGDVSATVNTENGEDAVTVQEEENGEDEMTVQEEVDEEVPAVEASVSQE